MGTRKPNHRDVIATTNAIYYVTVDGRTPVAMLADHGGSPIVMRFERLPRGWQKAPIMMVVRGDQAIGILYLTLPKRPKGASKGWSPLIEHWEDVADAALTASRLPKARAFTYVESYLEGSEGLPEFRRQLEDSKATFIAWVT